MPFLAIGLLASHINPFYCEQIKACLDTWVKVAEK